MEQLNDEPSEKDGVIETTYWKIVLFVPYSGTIMGMQMLNQSSISQAPLSSRKSNGRELVCYSSLGELWA